MTVFEFTTVVFFISWAAGFLGALTGLGGGVVVTPALTLLLGVDLRYAIGASLISVIATSSGAAAAFVREGTQISGSGCFLRSPQRSVFGAILSGKIPTAALAIIFGLMLLVTAWLSGHQEQPQDARREADPLAAQWRLSGTYPTPEGAAQGQVYYEARRVKTGFGLMFGAGAISGCSGGS